MLENRKLASVELFWEFLPTAYVVRREGYVLTRVCLSVQRGGGVAQPGPDRRVPQPGTDGGTLARSRWGQGGTPVRSGWGVPQPGPDGGTLARSGQGVPKVGYPPSQVRMEVPEVGYPPPGQVRRGSTQGGVPPSRYGVPSGRDGVHPPPQYRTADGILDTPRSVCLLRPRRRTFLYSYFLPHH